MFSICTQDLWSSARVANGFLVTSLTITPKIAQPGWTVSSGNIYFRMMEAAVPLETFSAAGNVFVAFLRSVHLSNKCSNVKISQRV